MAVSRNRKGLSIQFGRLSGSIRAGVLFVPVTIKDGKAVLGRKLSLPAELSSQAKLLATRHYGAKQAGAIDDLILPSTSRIARIALVGLGEEKSVKAADVRNAAAISLEWASRHRADSVVVALDALQEIAGTDAVEAWVEGSVLGSFRFLDHRSQPPDEARKPVTRLVFVSKAAASRSMRDKAEASRRVAESVNLARSIGHQPPNVINPVTLARESQALARKHGLRCRVIDDRQMKVKKMGAILAVGGGSGSAPRIIVLEHRPSRAKGKPIVLVGKAVTHDTGGYSIKPTASMVEMKYDKCGGMTVLGTLVAAARLKIPRHVVGVIGAAENMISGTAYRPSDIIRASNGKTIEVLDTDAEGRLVLADCLHYAEKTFSPAAMIDLATLTGACTVALGDACAGLLTTHDVLAQSLIASGERTNERLWRLPLWPVYREQIAGIDADLKNVGGRLAGTITAAMFLKEFVSDKTPWAHLDIAGVANSSKPSPTCPIGATGFGVRLLVDYLLGAK